MVFKGFKDIAGDQSHFFKGLKEHRRSSSKISSSTKVLNASNWGNEEARSFPQKYNWLMVSIENFQNELRVCGNFSHQLRHIAGDNHLEHSGSVFELHLFLLIFKLYSVCMKILATCIFLVYTSFPQRLKEELEPGNWSHGWLWTTKWVLQTQFWSSSYI